MIRIVASKSSAAAIAYFSEGLAREDYYSKDLAIPSRWSGKAAERLGLSGEVKKEDFAAMVENRHPRDGGNLTPRVRADRVCGYDISFHPPKSLSILQAMTGDRELLGAFRKAVSDTMAAIEAMAETRIRAKGAQGDRATGNLAWAEFIHTTTRPVDGRPDSHLHAHCFAMNATFDEVEDRWKAAKFNRLKSEAPVHQAVFHSMLKANLRELGYVPVATAKGWEIGGLTDKALLAKHSRRTEKIEAKAKKLGITSDKEKDKLGAKTRDKKAKGMKPSEILAEWDSRLSDGERAKIARTFERLDKPVERKITVQEAGDFAEAKLFERDSVIKRQSLVVEMLNFGMGHFQLGDVEREIERRGYIEKKVGRKELLTSIELIAEEAELVRRVRDSRGKVASICPGKIIFSRDFLAEEQKSAVSHVLKANDGVIALRGKAGAGKTTCLQEIAEQAEKRGFKVFAFAQSGDATEVLRKEGFSQAATIARLLVDEKLQQQLRSGKNLILVDEAGLVGVRDLLRVLEIADGSRVLLCGDTGQHAPVSRGDGLRLLEMYSGLLVATLSEIRRQKVSEYREAVLAFSEGRLKDAFRKLDAIGAIEEIRKEPARYARVASEWLATFRRTKLAPLVVSPTHAECGMVTDAIRAELKAAKILGAERKFVQYRQLRWEEIEKSRPHNFEVGMMLAFHQNVKGVKRGCILPVVEAGENGVRLGLENSASIAIDPGKCFRHFNVYEAAEISLAKGDLIRLTKNGQSVEGGRLSNGTLHHISKIGRDGMLTLAGGATLDPSHGHFDYGYCQTSHSMQGKTGRTNFIVQSARSFGGASQEQFFVSMSRGTHEIRIFTDNRKALQAAVGNSAKRISALEFSGAGEGLFMEGGLNRTEWAKRVEGYRVAAAERGNYLQKLISEGKARAVEKPHSISYEAMILTERAQKKQGGKGRGLGQPETKKLKAVKTEKGAVHQRGQIDFKAKEKAKNEVAPAKEKPRAKSAKVERMAKAIGSAKEKFKQIWGETKSKARAMRDVGSIKFHFGKKMVTPAKMTGAKVQEGQAQAKVQRMQKQPVQKPPLPAPVMRRGR